LGYKGAALSPDSVLLFRGDQKSLIKAPARKAPNLDKGAVIIVLNKHIFDRMTGFDVISSYLEIIAALISMGKKVYILRHSDEDAKLNEELFNHLPAKQKQIVELLNEDYYSYELEELISKADYVIGSRYHSIVHAYKQGTPAVVIGWAIKYRELAKIFRQTAFFFGGEDLGHPEKIIRALESLEKNKAKEASAISSVAAQLQKDCKIDLRP
jgi:colanic acid/amylovoran biosynthesis protein